MFNETVVEEGELMGVLGVARGRPDSATVRLAKYLVGLLEEK